MKNLVSVIIVNHNGRRYLKPCFNSLLRTDKGDCSLEIIMVDNLSKDNSVDFVRKEFPEVKVIENNVNNYTAALNLGIEQSRGEYIAFLNNDMTVDKEWLRGLIDVINQDEQIGAVQSKILFDDGKTINSVGVEEIEDQDLYFRDIAFGEKDVGKYDRAKEMEFFSGGSVLLRRSCVQNVGPFDEDFMFYVEDLDYSLRCHRGGWKIFYSPVSVVYHKFHGTASLKFCEYFCSRNRLLLIGKHFPSRLAQSVGTSQFCFRNEYDNLYCSLVEAVGKMFEYNDVETSTGVLKELQKAVRELFSRHKPCIFSEVEPAYHNIQPAPPRRDAGFFKEKVKKIPVLGFLAKTAVRPLRIFRRLRRGLNAHRTTHGGHGK